MPIVETLLQAAANSLVKIPLTKNQNETFKNKQLYPLTMNAWYTEYE